MRASRIFALARTMRWARVGRPRSGRRCAISSVVRPQTSRSVSATCASGARAGWQQVKISRRRSSSTSSPSHAAGSSTAASISLGQRGQRGVEAGPAAQRVDRLEAAGGDQPGPRVGRHAVARPLLDRRGEGVVQRLLGEVEVAEQADERGEHAARFGAVDGVHLLAHRVGGRLCHGQGGMEASRRRLRAGKAGPTRMSRCRERSDAAVPRTRARGSNGRSARLSTIARSNQPAGAGPVVGVGGRGAARPLGTGIEL